MELILNQLKALGHKVTSVVSDGKFYVDGTESNWHVCFRLFSPRTGEEFFYCVYGNFKEEKVFHESHTLVEVKPADRVVMTREMNNVKKLLKKKKEELRENSVLMLQKEIKKIDHMTATGFVPFPKDRVIVIHPLGFKEKEYFFTSNCNRQITSITSFKESDMYNLAPLSYWEKAFPSGGNSRVDWATAKSEMMDQARKRGIFQPRKIRGAGVWKDDGRIVVNMGDHLLVDGKRVELGKIKSKYFYTLGSALSDLHEKPLTSDECDVLIEACSTFKWIRDDFCFLLAGSLVVSRICGALPVRPHVWITGGANTGKSTLLEDLVSPILGDSMLYVLGSTSEAGIRQSLRADAIPVLFDEFETTGVRSGENVNNVIELLRSAWSDSSAMIIKGGSGGNATAYQVRCAAIVSSIRTKLTNDADRQRFAILELAPHGSNPLHWRKLKSLLDQVDTEYGDRLFARTIKMIPVLLENFKLLKHELSKTAGARFGDQYGMLLAGYSTLIQDVPLTAQETSLLASHVKLREEREETTVTDHEQALDHLLTKNVRIEVEMGSGYDLRLDKRELGLSEAIVEARTNVRVSEALQRLGIRVDSDFVAIASRHNEIEAQIFRGTQWSKTWANSLCRIPGAEKNKSVWMAKRNQKCVIIPGKFFW